jgi:hypothetical protein
MTIAMTIATTIAAKHYLPTGAYPCNGALKTPARS